MARTIKEQEYAVRRNEILDAAQRLVYTRGYEQMTVQNILNELEISKGAFYHYFDSKQDLMEAMVERMMDEALKVLNPLVEDPNLPAMEKLQLYFNTAGRWKTDRKELLLALLQTWYHDDNVIVRQKVFDKAFQRITPVIDRIVCQGVTEGAFNPTYPGEVGGLVMAMMSSFGDTFARLVLTCEPTEDSLRRLMEKVYAMNDALERILGAPPGSLELVDEATMREWVVIKKG